MIFTINCTIYRLRHFLFHRRGWESRICKQEGGKVRLSWECGCSDRGRSWWCSSESSDRQYFCRYGVTRTKVRDADEMSTIAVIVNSEKEEPGYYSRQRAWCWWGLSNCEVVIEKVISEGEAVGTGDTEGQSLKDIAMFFGLSIESPAPHISNYN